MAIGGRRCRRNRSVWFHLCCLALSLFLSIDRWNQSAASVAAMSLPTPSNSQQQQQQLQQSSTPPTTTYTSATNSNGVVSSSDSNPLLSSNNLHPSLESFNIMANYVSFLSNVCGALKQLKRTGWIRHQVPLPESDCDHMHRCAMCAMLVMSSIQQQQEANDGSGSATTSTSHTPPVDGIKLLKMALTHDLCEALAGDITPHCDAELLQSKHGKERAAMEHIRELLSERVIGDTTTTTTASANGTLGDELYQLWHEYEEQSTVEAIYCKDIDKFEMVLQAYEYEKQHLRPRQEVDDANEAEDDDDRPNNNVHNMPNPTTTTTNHTGNVSYLNQNVQHYPLRGFFISTNAAMKTSFFRQLDAQVRRQREAMLQQRGWNLTDLERQQPPPSSSSLETVLPSSSSAPIE